MTGTKNDWINYRIARAKDTYDDALILSEREKWNSTINRLYYAIMALLPDSDLKPTTHNGAKSNFSEYFIKTGKIDSKYGKMNAQLFTWRQKGDYDDLFDFSRDKVIPYFEPVNDFISLIESMTKK